MKKYKAFLNGDKFSLCKDKDKITAINNLDRHQIVEILEGYGFGFSDSETTDDLREALRDNVMEGTIVLPQLDGIG